MPDYIGWLRGHVGQAPVLLNFAACVVRDDAGRVLLQRRGDERRPVWGFPGGAVELGESVGEAAVREVREETGLTVRLTGLLGVYSKYPHTYASGDVAQSVTTFFLADVASGWLSADGGETLELGWFGLEALPELFTAQHVDAAADVRAGRTGVWR